MEHTNVGEFLKPDSANGLQFGHRCEHSSLAIVKTAFNAMPGQAILAGLCAAQVTANRLSRVRLLSQCPMPLTRNGMKLSFSLEEGFV